jgi:hypothetical protein
VCIVCVFVAHAITHGFLSPQALFSCTVLTGPPPLLDTHTHPKQQMSAVLAMVCPTTGAENLVNSVAQMFILAHSNPHLTIRSALLCPRLCIEFALSCVLPLVGSPQMHTHTHIRTHNSPHVTSTGGPVLSLPVAGGGSVARGRTLFAAAHGGGLRAAAVRQRRCG